MIARNFILLFHVVSGEKFSKYFPSRGRCVQGEFKLRGILEGQHYASIEAAEIAKVSSGCHIR